MPPLAATPLPTQPPAPPAVARVRLTVQGAVQGVGFRPCVYRLATRLGLRGWVGNDAHGVQIELEGDPAALADFPARLTAEKPPPAVIQRVTSTPQPPRGDASFVIRPSGQGGAPTTLVLPDLATCPACLAELRDPANRRYRYPFTNCTHCGPRYSIITALPYDRPHTTMARFTLCAPCAAEYHDPANRRFHAQPTACPVCGPQLALWSPTGTVQATGDAALLAAAAALRAGAIVAVKGLGGFHLLCAAQDPAAVRCLRVRKQREAKPFAVMFPDLAAVGAACHVSPREAQLLLSAAAPIVLLRRRAGAAGLHHVDLAPGNPTLGILLPYTPLHHLLLAAVAAPVVATSGNLSDEPICIDEHEALTRLAGLADLFLVHDRPIVRPVDDSVARVLLGEELLLRRARGYAPLPIPLPGGGDDHGGAGPVLLAVGGHQKNTVALVIAGQACLSQHLGDLDTTPAIAAFHQAIASLTGLYACTPVQVACDQHPDYVSTQTALALAATAGSPPPLRVQHHLAHVLAGMAEHGLSGAVLGVAWDGTGLGSDGMLWGGEFLRVDDAGWRRVAHLRPFALPGGELAAREPRRCALGLLHALLGDAVFDRHDLAPVRAFSAAELRVLRQVFARGINLPRTTSIGRLFDAVAALLDLHQVCHFEGQAAMALEFAATPANAGHPGVDPDADPDTAPDLRDPAEYHLPLVGVLPAAPWVADWGPLLQVLLEDLAAGVAPGVIAARFHGALASLVVQVARRSGLPRVVLSGGCFQNVCLARHTIHRLRAAGFVPSWPQRVPPNDGGLSLGQAYAAWRAQAPTTAPPP